MKMNDQWSLSVVDRRSFVLRALIYRAPDVQGQWIAHCPELDIVTQGNSPSHAIRMVIEATGECIIDDLNEGLEPLEVRGLDEAVARQCDRLFKSGTKMTSLDEADREADKEGFAIAFQWVSSFEVRKYELVEQAIERFYKGPMLGAAA
jgi:predicted RNase H-like HicB family nuclease